MMNTETRGKVIIHVCTYIHSQFTVAKTTQFELAYKAVLVVDCTYLSSAGINARQIDFSDELDFRWLIRVLLSTLNLQTVDTTLKCTLKEWIRISSLLAATDGKKLRTNSSFQGISNSLSTLVS